MNNNPKGHNQYTDKNKQDNQKKTTGKEKMSMSGADNQQSDGRKGHANNPEGHNQYTNKAK